MNLVIYSKLLNKQEEIQSIKSNYVPRIGDRVNLWYTPAPLVREVVWDYSEAKVIVFVD